MCETSEQKSEKYSLNKFKNYIKARRAKIPPPEFFVIQAFENFELFEKNEQYFLSNASDIILAVRDFCWHKFLQAEEEFTGDVILQLIKKSGAEHKTQKGLRRFLVQYSEHLHQAFLSNSQSRRARAGKEFELIIEYILMGLKIPFEKQASVGRKKKEGLFKIVDFVAPSQLQFEVDKNKAVLISLKTSLRERWSQTSEEKHRTSGKEIFLLTIDDAISNETLNQTYEDNVRIVVLKATKAKSAQKYERAMDFEEFFESIKDTKMPTSSAKDAALEYFKRQLSQSEIDFKREYFAAMIKRLLCD